MDKPVQLLNDYVLARAEQESAAMRAKLYRALAAVVGSEPHAKELLGLADELEAIDLRCRQLRLDLGDGQNGGRS